jgi:hypothetical protein
MVKKPQRQEQNIWLAAGSNSHIHGLASNPYSVRDSRIFNNKPSIECSQQEAMKIRNTILTLTFALVAGIGCDADRDSAPAAEVAIDSEIELAQPQPNVPACSRCVAEKAPPNTVFGDDTLSIDIDNAFNGHIISVTLTTWDSAGNPSYHYFPSTSTVVADINDPYTEETVTYIEATTAVSAQLLWVRTDGTSIEPIPVI